MSYYPAMETLGAFLLLQQEMSWIACWMLNCSENLTDFITLKPSRFVGYSRSFSHWYSVDLCGFTNTPSLSFWKGEFGPKFRLLELGHTWTWTWLLTELTNLFEDNISNVSDLVISFDCWCLHSSQLTTNDKRNND